MRVFRTADDTSLLEVRRPRNEQQALALLWPQCGAVSRWGCMTSVFPTWAIVRAAPCPRARRIRAEEAGTLATLTGSRSSSSWQSR
jgi:hypothetical protein